MAYCPSPEVLSASLAGLMAGLRVREALRYSMYMGLVSDSNLHIPGHPTSKSDLGVTEGFKKCYLPVTTV